MAERKVCLGMLCITDDPLHVKFDGTLWSLDEVYTNQFYCAMANAGVLWQRVMSWGVWGARPYGIRSQFAPYVLVGDRFDLSKFNSWYFPIVTKIIAIAKSYGIKTWWVLADNCQFHGAYKKWSPWVTNVNGVTTLWEDASHPYFKLWIQKCLMEFTGLDVGWAWGNETNNQHFRELAKEVIYPFVRNGEIVSENSTYGAAMDMGKYDAATGEYGGGAGLQDLVKKDYGAEFGEAEKLKVWREVHGVGDKDWPTPPNPEDCALTWWGNRPIKVWLSDDGVWDAESPCDKVEYAGKIQRRPSAQRWASIVEVAKERKNSFVFEHLPKASADWKCQAATMRSIYKAVFGVPPPEKWHYTPPVPPPPPPPPTVTVTVCKTSGLLPKEWCSEKEGRSFVVGSEPKTYCDVHKMPCSEYLARWNILGWLKCFFS